MARPRILKDLQFVKDVCLEYKKDLKPTLAGLCRRLNVIPMTLYSSMAVGDDISDELEDAYTYLIEAHEAQLWEKSPIPHIFYLKCIKRFGYQWKEQDNIVSTDGNKDHKLIIEVIREPKAEV